MAPTPTCRTLHYETAGAVPATGDRRAAPAAVAAIAVVGAGVLALVAAGPGAYSAGLYAAPAAVPTASLQSAARPVPPSLQPLAGNRPETLSPRWWSALRSTELELSHAPTAIQLPSKNDSPATPSAVPVLSAVKGVAALASAPLLAVAVFLVQRGLWRPAARPADLAAAVIADRPAGTLEEAETRAILPHLQQEGNALMAEPAGAGPDPWRDAPWAGRKWTVYRGVAYDLQPFFDAHPAGNWLLQLAIRRDCTALIESYHHRLEVARAHMARLPVLEGFPLEAVPRSPYPGDSPLYTRIKARLSAELFKGGGRGIQRSGSMDAALTTTLSFFAAAVLYAVSPSVLTGFVLGLIGAWVGMVTQHPGNHGALSTNPAVNNVLGLMADLVGGSGLCWQYHHNVSHHVHCNDEVMDEDVYSAYPVLRLDDRLPPKWFHKFQHLYMWPAFCTMHLVFFLGDFISLGQRRTEGAAMHGVDAAQRVILFLLKAAHLGLLLGLPAYLHGSLAVAIPGAIAYSVTWGLTLGVLFAVSHNTNPQKDRTHWARGGDWAVQQVVTSADWGGSVACWMTGGLSLQVVHHLFPAVSAAHYPAIRDVIEEECARDGVPYVHYPTLGSILRDFVIFMRDVGRAPFRPAAPATV